MRRLSDRLRLAVLMAMFACAAAACGDDASVSPSVANTQADGGGDVGAVDGGGDDAAAGDDATVADDAVAPADDATVSGVDVIAVPDGESGDADDDAGGQGGSDGNATDPDSAGADGVTADASADAVTDDAVVNDAADDASAGGDATAADSTAGGGDAASGSDSAGGCDPSVCNDGNPCTIDGCQPDGNCVWSSKPNLPCDDGNPCTSGDVCVGLQCKAGATATVCDDKNPCTTDSCDPKSGCVTTPVAGTCDDGDKCTDKDACVDGKCKGAPLCDDGQLCTKDTCSADGVCSWTAINGACDDGNPCTNGDTCTTGSCKGTAVVCDDKNPCTADSCDPKSGCVTAPVAGNPTCDDGSKCTSGDICAGGKCGGKAIDCADGNVCTNDGCDAATGECKLTANSEPCNSGDKCVQGQCKNGSCQAGSAPKSCDDKNPCTADSCDKATGACVHTAANDGAPCDDGIACTKASACSGGGCKPTSSCLVFADSFECGAQPTFTYFVPPPANNNPPRKVVWAVDATPAIPAFGTGCTLNYNDGVDYCDQIGFNDGANVCQWPNATATSPLLDFSVTGGLVPTVTMDTYYDVDNFSQTDSPRIRVLENGTNAVLKQVIFPKNNGDLKALKKGYQITIPEGVGKKFRLELSLTPSTQSNTSTSNVGAGWFVDNMVIEATVGGAEVCGNGVDDNFNGAADCADAACKGQAACKEACSDAIDNDVDGLVDCADSDCTANVVCQKALFSWPFDKCDNGGLNISNASGNNVTWAVDATPNPGKFISGTCALNYNNGTNYCTAPNCPGNQGAAAGTATTASSFDLPAGKKLTVAVWAWLDVEVGQNQSASFDNTWLEVSTSGFACAQGPTNCPSQNNPYAAGTVSYQLPRDILKSWVERTFDISALAGKAAVWRVRFNSVDGQFNGYGGPFIDDVRIYAQ